MGSGNVKKFEVKLAKTGIIILVAGMTVLVCLSFILGISVGKDMDAFPGKIASFPRRIAESVWRPAKVPARHTAESPQDKPEKVTIDLSFHKDLTSEKLPSMQPAPPVQTRPAPEPKPQSPPQSEDSIIEDILKKQEPLSEEAFSVEKPSPEKEAKAAQAVRPAEPGYIVHVTSLKDRRKAALTNETIASMGYASKVAKVELKGKGTWYRVIVTGFESRAKAQMAAEKIGKKVNATCAVWPVHGNADKKP